MSYIFFFFFKQKTAYEMLRSLVGSEMCIRDRWGPLRFFLAVVVAAVVGILIWTCAYEVPTSESTLAERQEEFLRIPSTERLRANLEYYAAMPHVAGSPRDKETAEWTRDQLVEYGIDARIREYRVLLTAPLRNSLRVVAPSNATGYVPTLREKPLPDDPITNDPTVLPPFHGYSASGNVTGQLVYVNYGRVEDFEWLAAQGVSVEAKLVIVRYGAIFRGNKVANAEARGAVGVLVYSDPANYGPPASEEGYPESEWLPLSGAQRGSVFTGEGDPLTPGWASTNGSLRLSMEQARNGSQTGTGWALPTIPLSLIHI
eukprot:TRINITY_DN5380_c0_g1_i6.p1 TRINITY_DN5380_c0_g1~~TRINITY_DN5380_c0_g1_i6.p1  ORF type:complete len:316 (-),score=80.41 TRINITY_DN5380_c0_g1_i6:168-1115(-)